VAVSFCQYAGIPPLSGYRLRLYLRLAHRWRWLSDGQHADARGQVAAIGKLLDASG